MAPMAGITGPAFRSSVRRFGAGLVFTEMISAQGIVHDNHHTLAYLACTPADHPIGFQLFAAEPDVLARAARRSLVAGADLIDLNRACPARKVMKTGAGAALLDTPDLAVACVRAVVEEVAGEAPVTVKIRAGVRSGDEAGLRVAPRLVAAGAAAVCIHPRYADQLYKGVADHTVTLALVRELPVPVIASGDIATPGPDGRVDRTGSADLLDGGVTAVMVARAALGRPWVFEELLEGGPAPSRDERRRALACFVDDVSAELGPRAVGYLRRFWPRFRRSGALTPALAAQLMTAADLAEVARLVPSRAAGTAAGETGPGRDESV
jgi:tRNA-dihydrouridine synthase B